MPMKNRPSIREETPADPVGAAPTRESKTRRKQVMHDLQALGEALVDVEPRRLAELGLPETLADAIGQARRITAHEGRRRQMQYVGRLMRGVDPEPIRAALDRWNQVPRAEKERFAALEAWRTRLLEDPSAIDRFVASRSPVRSPPSVTAPTGTPRRAPRASCSVCSGASPSTPETPRAPLPVFHRSARSNRRER
jgi:ribosome-associated protein